MVELTNYVQSLDSDVKEFSGILNIIDGKLTSSEVTVLHSRSIAEDVFFKNGNDLFTGKLNVSNGKINENLTVEGTWCYYGDRSTAYIFGEKGVFWYRNFYVICFILAAVIDTTIVWNIAYVVVALVSIPNLIALFVLRKEVKQLSDDYSF